MKKAGTGWQSGLTTRVTIEKNKVPAGHTLWAEDSSEKHSLQKKMFGVSGPVSAEQYFPVEHGSQKW